MTVLFFLVLGVLFVLLAQQTIILIELLIQALVGIIVAWIHVCKFTVRLGEAIGRRLWRVGLQDRRRTTTAGRGGQAARGGRPRTVAPTVKLIERNGVYVPMNGEW